METILYKGKVTLRFDEFRHKYTHVEASKEIKSVTTALKIINKPMLVNWAANMAVDHIKDAIEVGKSYDEVELVTIFKTARNAHYHKKESAADIGTLLHGWIEDYINEKNPGIPVNPILNKSVNKFLE